MQYNGFRDVMPILYQHTINNQKLLAVWHIQEPLSFFQKQVNIEVPQMHPIKQLQHLASRFLLTTLQPGFPLADIQKSESGKPYIPKKSSYFSISHCGDYAAVIISESTETGIDVEIITPKATMLQSRFLSDQERKMVDQKKENLSTDQLHTLCWSMKETMFKWYGKGGVDFKKHMEIIEIPDANTGIAKAMFKKNQQTLLEIQFKILGDLILTWTIHSHED
jgi:phosphopantetheine--protein transferase-like protein